MSDEMKDGAAAASLEDQPEATEQNADLPPAFRPVAAQHGRDMFTLVLNAGMAKQAMQVLEQLVVKHHSKHGLHAVQVMANSFNQNSNELVRLKGWTEEQLVHCDRDIQLAFQGQIVTPGSSIILNG